MQPAEPAQGRYATRPDPRGTLLSRDSDADHRHGTTRQPDVSSDDRSSQHNARVWQYAKSPFESAAAARCAHDGTTFPSYSIDAAFAPERQCYVVYGGHKLSGDVSSATTDNPALDAVSAVDKSRGATLRSLNPWAGDHSLVGAPPP